MKALSLFFAVPLTMLGSVQAGLDFEKATQAVTVKTSDMQIASSFAFTVSGDKDVKITDIRTFCSCVKADTSDGKKIFAPGTKGVIETVFEVGGFEGKLKKEVVVSTDDPKQPTINLVLEVTIPALYEIKPAQLAWRTDEGPVMKSVRLKVLGEEMIHVTKAVSSRDAMATAVKEITPGKEYELQMTPASTEKKMLGLVRMELDSKFPRYQKRLVFFNVTDKPPGEPGGPPAAAAVPAPAPDKKP